MEEQLVPYKTAVLTKEKGFNIPVRAYWVHNTTEPLDDEYYTSQFDYPHDYNGVYSLSAPPQYVLQKWLREKHKIHIIIEPAGENFDLFVGYCCETQKDVVERELEIISTNYKDIKFYSSYEEALDDLLLEALNRIK